MIEVKNLSKHYGQNTAIDNISFSVEEGSVVGFLGPNGAGKSTTMNIITGYLSASSGTVTVGGFDILEKPNEVKKLIGYLPEIPPLYPDMTVEEFLNYMYDLKKVTIPRKKHIKEICELLKISDVYGRLIANLSKGYRQRVGFAQALLGNPSVLILDEPTVGLDPKQIIEIRNMIKELGKSHTIILSSHILPEIQAVCERIIIINKGNLVADGTRESISQSLGGENKVTLCAEGSESEIFKGLKNINNVEAVECGGEKEPGVFEYYVFAKKGCDIRRDIFNYCSKNNYPVLRLVNSALSLEDVFLRLTSDNNIEVNPTNNEESGDKK